MWCNPLLNFPIYYSNLLLIEIDKKSGNSAEQPDF
jgi:hypothetical protein